MKKTTIKKLKLAAKKASTFAYSPYSNINVGAAVLTINDKIFSGANVENMSFGGTICAERTAICKAVSEGHQEFKALYLYTKEQWTPCGICLQFMSEFLKPDDIVILGSDKDDSFYKFKDLMPRKTDLVTFNKLKK